ncbi:DUF3048 domain-containing protein [Jatrophihabitans fulvus]
MTARPRPEHARPGARVGAIGLVTVLALGLAACTSDDKSSPSSSGVTPPPSSDSSPTPKPKAVDPLTGGKVSKNGVVAVKIDDTANGRPQRNIDKADVVYIEEVEGGLTRLVAVFHTSLPLVESVRSTRPADPELVSQYGRIAYVASGGASVPLRLLDRSFLKTSINDRGGPGFARAGDKPAPYNLTADLAVIAKRLKAPRPKDVGFDWSSSSAQAAKGKGGQVVSTVVGATPITFRYDTKIKQYVRFIDGQPVKTQAGRRVATPNVLVQFCKVETFNADRDVNGNPNKFTHTIGKGKAVLFRNGKRLVGTWSRPSLTKGTTFRTSGGAQMQLKPGGVWVVLTRTGAPLA